MKNVKGEDRGTEAKRHLRERQGRKGRGRETVREETSHGIIDLDQCDSDEGIRQDEGGEMNRGTKASGEEE